MFSARFWRSFLMNSGIKESFFLNNVLQSTDKEVNYHSELQSAPCVVCTLQNL